VKITTNFKLTYNW